MIQGVADGSGCRVNSGRVRAQRAASLPFWIYPALGVCTAYITHPGAEHRRDAPGSPGPRKRGAH